MKLIQNLKFILKNLSKSILFFIFLITNAIAVEVTWGGVAFVDNNNVESLYPNLSKIGINKLDEWAYNALKKDGSIRKFNNFEIKVNRDGEPVMIDKDQTEGIIMSVVFFADDTFFGENISVKGVKTYDNTYQLYGALVFFEFGSGSYVNSVPLIQERTVAENNIPGPQKIEMNFNGMLDGSFSKNYFNELFNRAKDTKVNEFPEKFAKFGEVTFGPTVEQFFNKNNEVQSWKFRINKQYENELSSYSKIPIVPSGPNAELNEFRAIFKDASYKIVLGEAVFVFNVNLKIFKKIDRPNKNNTYRTVCHIVGLKLAFIDDSFEEKELVMDVPFVRAKKSCGVIGINNVVDDAYFFPMNLLAIIQNSASQFKNTDQNYLKSATQGKEREALNQINKVKSILFE